MRDPTFRRILRAATSKFNQMICPLMASVCVRDLCMFWNDHSKSCYIVDTLKANLYHTICPKCGSTSVTVSAHEGRSGKSKRSGATIVLTIGVAYTERHSYPIRG